MAIAILNIAILMGYKLPSIAHPVAYIYFNNVVP
jgi:hypothetical protein